MVKSGVFPKIKEQEWGLLMLHSLIYLQAKFSILQKYLSAS